MGVPVSPTSPTTMAHPVPAPPHTAPPTTPAANTAGPLPLFRVVYAAPYWHVMFGEESVWHSLKHDAEARAHRLLAICKGERP